MFACSVCFYGTEVLTGKHYFQSNEILTACLNLRTGDLRAILEELKFLRQKIQLPEELDIEFNENYDELPLFLNAATVAKVLGIAPSSSYELIHEKDFPALRIGNRIVVPKEAFIRWVEQHTGGTE